MKGGISSGSSRTKRADSSLKHGKEYRERIESGTSEKAVLETIRGGHDPLAPSRWEMPEIRPLSAACGAVAGL